MGSGKTTVGKILSEVLRYSFFDRFTFFVFILHIFHQLMKVEHCLSVTILFNTQCLSWLSDKLVEQSVGVSSVAQIFKQYSEAFFRDNEVISTYYVHFN